MFFPLSGGRPGPRLLEELTELSCLSMTLDKGSLPAGFLLVVEEFVLGRPGPGLSPLFCFLEFCLFEACSDGKGSLYSD